MFRYARCVGATPCLAVNGAACAGLIVFAGDRVPGVVRDGPALDKYFEEPTLTALTTMSTVFFGATEWSAVAPTTDLVACIP